MADWCCDADRQPPPPREAVAALEQYAEVSGLVGDAALDALGFCAVAGLGEVGQAIAERYSRYELATRRRGEEMALWRLYLESLQE